MARFVANKVSVNCVKEYEADEMNRVKLFQRHCDVADVHLNKR